MKYHLSELVQSPGPFSGFVKATGVLCSDGKRRNTVRLAATGDTFFSVPAAVRVNGKTVSGYVTVETMQGNTTRSKGDPETVKFIAYSYGKNADQLPAGAWTGMAEMLDEYPDEDV